MASQYFVYNSRKNQLKAWTSLSENAPISFPNETYIRKALKVMEEEITHLNLIFYISFDAVDKLPSYGNNVVAVIVGDEWARTPKYAHKVKAIFKCYGTSRMLGIGSFRKSPYLNLLTIIWYFRIIVAGLPYRITFLWNNLISKIDRGLQSPSVFHIPLGYCNQNEIPIKGIESREIDVSFAGSLTQRKYSLFSPQRWLKNPKTISREKMINHLQSFEAKNPDHKVSYKIQKSFRASEKADPSEYSLRLMNTKICLVPRGASFETFRFFEGLRYGCIVLTESLPKTWFYNGSPVIRLTDWSQLEIKLGEILKDKNYMHKKHQESLNWWQEKCSEKALGSYMAERLKEVL